MKANLFKKITLNTLIIMNIEEKRNFQELINEEIMKANHLKKIT